MKTLVLAAGLGTRLSPLTDHLPKALAPVAGRPAIEILLDRIAGEVIVNAHAHADLLRARLGERVRWSHEAELLGTAGALRGAHALLGDDDVMVLSGDGLHEVDLGAVAARHRQSGAAATITVKRLADPSCCAQVELDAAGMVARFAEKPPPEHAFSELASIGIYCFSAAAREHIPAERPSDNARDLIPALLAAGLPVAACHTAAPWADIGTLDELLAANLALAGGEAVVHAGCRVANGARLDGPAQIGPGASIGEGAVVASSVVLPGAEVPADAEIRGTIFGDPAAVVEAWRRW